MKYFARMGWDGIYKTTLTNAVQLIRGDRSVTMVPLLLIYINIIKPPTIFDIIVLGIEMLRTLKLPT